MLFPGFTRLLSSTLLLANADEPLKNSHRHSSFAPRAAVDPLHRRMTPLLLFFCAIGFALEFVNRSPRIYIIFSRPRSGTNMLEDFLDSNQSLQLDHGSNEIMADYGPKFESERECSRALV
jgi:hypothetical protein